MISEIRILHLYILYATLLSKIMVMNIKLFQNVVGFEWDSGNKDKNLTKHKVANEECEEIFFDSKKRVLKDVLHSGREARYVLFGKTKKGRLIFTVFTIRNKKIRIISARDTNKKEIKLYEQE